MLTVTAKETATEYIFTVTDDVHSFSWPWGKQPLRGQTLTDYLQSCKREAELLAGHEIARSQATQPITL